MPPHSPGVVSSCKSTPATHARTGPALSSRAFEPTLTWSPRPRGTSCSRRARNQRVCAVPAAGAHERAVTGSCRRGCLGTRGKHKGERQESRGAALRPSPRHLGRPRCRTARHCGSRTKDWGVTCPSCPWVRDASRVHTRHMITGGRQSTRWVCSSGPPRLRRD